MDSDASPNHLATEHPQQLNPNSLSGKFAAGVKRLLGGKILTWAILALFACILAFQLLAEPITGLANNGDFERVTSQFGLTSTYTTYDLKYFNFVNRYYTFGQPYDTHFSSSLVYVIDLALVINAFLSKSGMFEITSMGIANSLLYLSALVFILNGLRRKNGLFALAALLIFIIFLDVGYISYFNSFYSEPTALISVAFMVGLTLIITGGTLTRLQKGIGLAIYLAALLFLLTNKTLFTAAGLFFIFILYRLSKTLDLGKKLKAGIAYGLVIVTMAAGLAYAAASTPAYMAEANLFNAVFYGAMINSPDPQQDAQDLGIDPAYASLAGKHYWNTSTDVLASEQFKTGFLGRISYLSLAKFYLQHPGRFIQQMSLAANSSAFLSPADLGMFDQSANLPPLAHSRAFNLWSAFRERFFPRSLWAQLLFLAVNLVVAGIKRFRLDASPSSKITSELHLTIVLASLSQMVVAIFASGQYEIIKHLFLYNVLFDACLVFLVLELAWFISYRLKARLPIWLSPNRSGL